MSALAPMLDRSIGTARKAMRDLGELAAGGNAAAGAQVILLDCQLSLLAAMRELHAREARKERPKTQVHWFVPELVHPALQKPHADKRKAEAA